MTEELSEFVGAITTAVTRRADIYVELLDEADLRGTLAADEQECLDRFETYAADILERYVPPGPRRRDSLVFAHLYVAEPQAERGARRRALLTALLAGEAEARGPLRLTQAQSIRLAEVFKRLGSGLLTDGLVLHAALAFDRAAGLYLQVGDHRARDGCLLAQARARHRAPGRGALRVLEALSSVLCGYGYQPYRLLGWVVFQLAAFSVALSLISGISILRSSYMCLVNYLNPLGLGDTAQVPHSAWVLLVAEGYLGSVSLSVFFALVVRRWFRA
jgi:hypothetical protein